MALNIQPDLPWSESKHIHMLEWPSQNPDRSVTRIKKINSVHICSPSSLTDLELFRKQEWAKMSASRCAKLIETYPKRLAVVMAAKGGPTKY